MSELQHDVTMAEKMDISIERVKKLNDPLLVIGLGGTGSDIVYTIKKLFAERYELPRDRDGNLIPVPRRTDYLVIDSDVNGLEGFEMHEKLDITLSGMKAILNDPTANLKDYEKKWVNPMLKADSVGKGAGASRQAARLMLSRNYSKVRTVINSKIQRLVSVRADDTDGKPGRINVVICAGISGGTGSGTFLDVAQIVRSCLDKDLMAGQNSLVTGYLAMPDISCAKTGNDPHQDVLLKSNAYAALKELDFWMRVNEHETRYEAQYSNAVDGVVPWTRAPFDACVLLSGSSTDGAIFADSYEKMRYTVAETLLHYLAAETDEEGKQSYTYISYEDNLKSKRAVLKDHQPLHLGYRAVGAYTKRIPKMDIIYYEGSKLLNVFVPPKDPNGQLVPNIDLLNDGQNVFRIAKIAGNLNDLLRNVCTHVALPSFLNTPVDAMQNMNPKPHERADFANPNRWESDVLPPAMAKHAERYLNEAWDAFRELAQSVITDPQRGPFSLRAYLDNASSSSLLAGLEGVLQDWKDKRSNLESKRPVLHQACETAYPSFVRPPLLGRQHAIDNYTEALNRYYSQVRAQAFLNAYITALSRLVLRVKEYLNTSLSHMCYDLLTYHRLFETTVKKAEKADGDTIYQLSAVSGQIDAAYTTNNIDHKFERQLLGALCAASFETIENVDPHSSGVSFLYQRTHHDVFYAELHQVLENCFGSSNGQNLDTIMEQQVGSDVAQQNAYMDGLLSSVLLGSQPLFAQDSTKGNESVATYSYLSVPMDAAKFLERYHQYDNVQLKPSALKDHIYCLTSWDGLPLYRYAIMENLEEVYCSTLGNRDASMGIHLVYDGNAESNYQKNWSKLPSPRPYYMFGKKGTAFAQREYAHVHELVMQALATGLVTVDTSEPSPAITLRLQYTDAHKTTFKPSEMMIPEIDAICHATDPVTGGVIRPAEQAQRVRSYLAAADTITIKPDCSPSIMAPHLGMSNEDINPWDSSTMANPLLLEKARKNFRKLSEELAAAVISLYPMYVLGLEMQVKAAVYADNLINTIEGQQKVWQPRTEFAPVFARLFIHGVLSPSLKGYQYVDAAGQRVPILEKHLLAADLENELPLLKHACYLADLTGDHIVRKDLEMILADKEQELEDKDASGTLTKDDLLVKVAAIDRFIKTCTEDQAKYSSKRREPGADLERLEKIQKFYAEMVDTVKGLKATYEDVIAVM